MIATIAFNPEDSRKSKSPNPVIEMGPRIATTIPPPTNSNTHMVNTKMTIDELKPKHPSEMP